MIIDTGQGATAAHGQFTAGARIDVRGLSMTYETSFGPVQALDNVSLAVSPGSSLAIVGPSGCGKSTLLGILGGLELPTAGDVSIGADMVSAMTDQQRAHLRRRAFGFVFQADNLQPFLTVTENIGLQAAMAGIDDKPSRSQELLDALDLGSLGHRFPDQLSGGQRQRVAVARALVHSPSVVLADEPTGSLDTSSSEKVTSLLLRLHQEVGSTLVVVTHDRSVAERMDVMVEISAGRMADSRGERP